MTKVEHGMLVHYDRAKEVLQRALESSRVEVVLASRDELGHIKLHARQIRDRKLLADAFEFQMRVERRLGVLLAAAEAAGQLRRPGQRGAANVADGPARLHEVGVDRRLSAKARRTAALDERSFETAVSEVRATITAGRVKLANTIDDATRRRGEKRGERKCSVGRDNPFAFQLADGTLLGLVKVGKLRSRIDQLAIELAILTSVKDRIGTSADVLASVADSVSKVVLGQIIEAAKSN